MTNPSGKTCSICGEWKSAEEFEYGNRVDRSYCKKCNREERAAYTRGGREAAKEYREKQRDKWSKT